MIDRDTNILDALMILENERKFYDQVYPAVQEYEQAIKLAKSGDNAELAYKEYRNVVYTAMRHNGMNYLCADHRLFTSYATLYFYERYAKDSSLIRKSVGSWVHWDWSFVKNTHSIRDLAELRYNSREFRKHASQGPVQRPFVGLHPDAETPEPPHDDTVDALSYALKVTKAAQDNTTETIITLKEITMNATAPAIEVKTFIRGVEAKDLSDDQIFNEIRRIEKDIEELDKVKSKPKKLAAKIEEMHKSIKELTEYVDGR